MKRNHILAALSTAALIFLQSCNFPRPTPAGPQNAVTATALADTQQAEGVPVTGGTGTPSQTVLSVRDTTNCYAGPGKAYNLVVTLEPGSGFLVIGKNSAGKFWIIANPAGGTCWVAARNATVAGDTSRLPEYPAPPKLTGAATATSAAGGLPAPDNLFASRVCGKSFNGKTPIWVEDVVLTCLPSGGQAGYRVYRDNQPVTPVPGNMTTDNIQFSYPRDGNLPPSDTFSVEAFNGSNTSPVASVDVPRCP